MAYFLALFCFFVILLFQSVCLAFERSNPVEYLNNIHSRLQLRYGNFADEYPEQLMAARFLPVDAKVLEIGGNVGRNTCVIASILTDSSNLVSLESDWTARILEGNRDLNRFHFHVENAAISKRALIQSDWSTIPGEIVLPGYFKVNTVTFEELEKKYNMKFDTLVADCEGALYYILQDDPDILNNLKLIIIENDFPNLDQFEFVQQKFKTSGFALVYNEVAAPYVSYSTKNCFYQVWQR